MSRSKSLPALVLATSLAAVALIAGLQVRSDQSRRAQADLGTVGAQLNERSFAAMASMFGTPAPVVHAHMDQLKQQVQHTVRRLRAEEPVPELADVERALDRTFAADQANLVLIRQMATRQGRVALADMLVNNDPQLTAGLARTQAASARMARALDRATAAYAQRAERARLQAAIGTAGAIALLVILFGLTYRRAVRARADAEALAGENARMAEIRRAESLTDSLTGLGNRRALIAALDDALADPGAGPLALALFDLDGFKQYNDSFGHQAGDSLLRRLGGRLADELGDVATAYRMGGDEFCVLARLDGEDAVSIARRGAAALSDTGDAFAVGCSFGIAFAPSEATSPEEALRIADQRMYEQKAGNRRAAAAQQSTDVLLQVLNEQNQELASHSDDVARLAVATAERLGMTLHEISQVRLASELHDVGKSAIPGSILNKPGPLDEEEWQFIRRHTIIGDRIVRAAPSLGHAAPLIRSSHERIDGTGYPDGLAAEEIPLGARIIAVCDAFDAMTTARPYHEPVSVEAACAELRRCAGTQFDPGVVEHFCALVSSPSPV
jgi:diguanylate cyclase (GGDEF)-like protein